MIIFRVFGGLGNQMFQYAFGRYLSVVNNEDLFIDSSYFDNGVKIREFGLSNFNVKCIISSELYKSSKYFKNAFLNKVFNIFKLNFNLFYETKVCVFNESLIYKKSGYFDGYWQSYYYFSSIRSILIEEFKPLYISEYSQKIEDIIKNSNSIGLHVRKTDYLTDVNSSIYSVCTVNYYYKAINYFSLKYSNVIFFIFTDDIEWVKNNLNFSGINYVHVSSNPNEDLYLMSRCNHNIIANSTFSWWSAWLNTNDNKEVVAPLSWFTEESKISHNIVPSSWIRIEN